MPKCDFNKVAKQWVGVLFSSLRNGCFSVYLQNTFSYVHLRTDTSISPQFSFFTKFLQKHSFCTSSSE